MALTKLIKWLLGSYKTSPLPEDLWQQTLATLLFLDRLNADERSRLKQLSEDFLAEKEFSSAGGLELTDAMCVSIAVQACLPILNLGLRCYRGWVGIVVYPDEFIIPRVSEDEFGVVHEFDDIASGEAWEGGPVLISWNDAQMAGTGYNVVIHEFAHKLDMLNGDADGLPPLPPGLTPQVWEETLLAAYDDFCQQVDEAEQRGQAPLLDPYAAESPAEFFAVMSETFFEIPELLKKEYSELYTLLSRFYRQDPDKRPLHFRKQSQALKHIYSREFLSSLQQSLPPLNRRSRQDLKPCREHYPLNEPLQIHQQALRRPLNVKRERFLRPFPEAFLHNMQFLFPF